MNYTPEQQSVPQQTVNSTHIPAYIKNRPQWVMWRLEKRKNGKTTKVPYQPTSLRIGHDYAKSDDPSTLSDYETCLKALETGNFDGIGFCFKEGDYLSGVDLDHCLNSDGQPEPWAATILEQFGSTYTEYSPSGDGIHIWCHGKPVRTGSKKWKRSDGTECGIEVYNFSSPRYLTITSNYLNEGNDISNAQSALDWLFGEYWAEQHQEPKQSRDQNGTLDIELVRKALACIPADDYATWITVGMALKAAGLSFDIWHEWSRLSIKYEPEVCEKKWETFNGARVGIGTVFYLAQKKGFEFPRNIHGSLTVIRNDGNRLDSRLSPVPMWPTLHDSALIGLIGDFVKNAAVNTEADPAAILFNLLPFLGCIIGNNSYIEIGDDKHPPRLFTLTVGATGRGRKGTAAAPIKKLAKRLPDCLKIRVTPGPLSSGEGLINSVRDASEKLGDNNKPVDQGVIDKRLFVLSSEFASALAVFKREGNTLATTLRALFDDGDADTLTKNNPTKATGAHVCITSHITREELLKRLDDNEIYSGTMNRFLLGCVRRSKQVPNPKPIDEAWLTVFVDRLSKMLLLSKNCGAVGLTTETEEAWNGIYSELTKDESGLVGALISRSEALTKRIALLYALLDDWEVKPTIDIKHLRAALSIIDYSRNSARFIYGSPEANKERDVLCHRILKAIVHVSAGLSQTELHDALNRNVDATKLHNALAHLQAVGTLTQYQVKTGGRSKTVWMMTDGFSVNMDEINENDEES